MEERVPLPDTSYAFSKENYRHMKALLEQRVGSKRFNHSVNVARVARDLAKTYGYDPDKARMAGILHDWDKGLKFDEARERVLELGLDLPQEMVDNMPWLLHGPTAAEALRRTYPEFGNEVFQAIARHTSGAADMAPLDCIIYVADIIEPDRTFGDAQQIEVLRGLVGQLPLDELYFRAFKYTLGFLISWDKQLSPQTLSTWNALMFRYGQAAKGALNKWVE